MELKILWSLKRSGGFREVKEGAGTGHGFLGPWADELECTQKTLGAVLRGLEEKSVILRTYKGGKTPGFAAGYRPLLRVELVDPQMKIPPIPPLSPGFVMERENEEEYIRCDGDVQGTDPTPEAVILALLNRNDELAARILELEGQINKLQDIVEEQANKLTQASQERTRNRKYPEHLTGRIQDALTPEQWERLRHGQ